MRVLTFDSGVGGLSVVDALIRADRDHIVDYVADSAWLPYGDKTEADILARAPRLILQVAEKWDAGAIIVACNTASTIILPALRAMSPVPVIGVVPPIKPAAALSQSKLIAMLATPATIARAYTDDLIAQFAADAEVIRVGSTALVTQAEALLAGAGIDLDVVAREIAPCFVEAGARRTDVVALACTHFPLLREVFEKVAPWPVTWLDSGDAIARRLSQVVDAGAGHVRAGRAAFSDPSKSAPSWPAFHARGFVACFGLDQNFVPDRAPSA
jgi:glutamate racemase